MPTFVWHDCLTVSVGEMSRAAALTCARQFDAAASVFGTYDELMTEADALVVLNAPAVVKFADTLLDNGTRELHLDNNEVLTLTLPLTRAGFDALPMSLASDWIDAAIKANGWFVETLKKAIRLASPTNNEPKSGAVPLNEPTTTNQETRITGA